MGTAYLAALSEFAVGRLQQGSRGLSKILVN
jgi:hypothetical protein